MKYPAHEHLVIVSNIFSLITVAVSVVGKVPQILTLYCQESARGTKILHTKPDDSLQNYLVISSSHRHQFLEPLYGHVQLHGHDGVQLQQRLFSAVVHGLSDYAGPDVCVHDAGAEHSGSADTARMRGIHSIFHGHRAGDGHRTSRVFGTDGGKNKCGNSRKSML